MEHAVHGSKSFAPIYKDAQKRVVSGHPRLLRTRHEMHHSAAVGEEVTAGGTGVGVSIADLGRAFQTRVARINPPMATGSIAMGHTFQLAMMVSAGELLGRIRA